MHPEDLDSAVHAWNKSVEDRSTFQETFRLRSASGDYRWFQVRAEPFRNEAGQLARWYGLDIDIDDARRMAEELRLAQVRLSRAAHVASIAELSASIAHQVNQPLAAVVANAHACLRWLSLADPNIERARISAKDIISDANDAAEVIRRIRGLFAKQAPSKIMLSVNATIVEVIKILRDELARNEIAIVTELASNLPSVAADQIQLQQVIVNLIQNATEAMVEMPDPREIKIQSAQGDVASVAVSVTDNGPGLSATDDIFDAFFTTKPKGMGMGLSICRSIIEAHGGKIWAETAAPKGTRLTFELPLGLD